MQNLLDDFLQYVRHERGQSEATQKAYAGLLGAFVEWAGQQGIKDWGSVEYSHLTAYILQERDRPLKSRPVPPGRKLTSESVYLAIAALRAFFD